MTARVAGAMVLLLRARELEQALTYPACIDAVEAGFRDYASGRAHMPVRLVIPVKPYDGIAAFMPAYLAGMDRLGVKVVSAFRQNPTKHGLPTVLGVVLLLDQQTGQLVALMDGAYVTAVRTAAASAVATKYLAREGAATLGLFGAGVQAETHLLAINAVRTLSEVRVYSRTENRCREFCQRMGERTGLPVKTASPRSVAEADIVTTVTTSKTPVFEGTWLRPGTHVNGVGSHTPDARELDHATIARSKIVVDSRDAALKEAGDFLIPMAESAFNPSAIYAELGEIVVGAKPGRSSREEITLFKSVGLAIEDVAAAAAAYTRARALGVGEEITL